MPPAKRRSNKVKKTNWSAISTIIAAVALVISAWFSYRTLDLMESQRKTGLRPDLFIAPTTIGTACIKKEDIDAPALFGYECYGNCDPDNDGTPTFPTKGSKVNSKRCHFALEIHNKAIGTAKRIKVSWKYDKELTHQLFTETFKNAKIDYKPKHWIITLNNFRVRSGPVSSDEITEFGFIAPNGSISVNIPDDYIETYFSVLIDSQDNEIYDKYPNLALQIDFEDIEGELFKKFFSIKPVWTMAANNFVPGVFALRFELVAREVER